MFCTVVPDKKPANRWLIVDQTVRNQIIFSDRVLIENYFGHLCMFTTCSFRWRWNVLKYFKYLRFRIALTNARVM